ncbi:hypothetical protein RB601_008107 [Gaeumannomyces tritici]
MDRTSKSSTDEPQSSVEPDAIEAGQAVIDVEKLATQERLLVSKLDRSMLPILFLMYFMNHIDRNALPQARLDTLEEDLGLHGWDYNVCISVFFIGYLLMQIPSNMFITRVRPSIYLSSCMLGWACLSGTTAAVRDARGLATCRFFLGFVEAPFYPGALYLLSSFYTRDELAVRIAFMYMGQILSSGLAGLVAAGVFKGMHNVLGLSGWRWLYAVEASVTAAVALLGYWLLPDSPAHTRWLTADERALAVERVARDRVATTTTTAAAHTNPQRQQQQQQQQEGGATAAAAAPSALDGLYQAAGDPRTWLFCLMQNMHVSACTFNNFFPSIVRATRLAPDQTRSLLLTAPPYVVSGLASVALGWSSGRLRDRVLHTTAGLALAIAGFALSLGTESTAARYAATFVYATGAYAVGPVILGWVGSTLSQSHEKRAVAYALVNVSASVAAIYGAFLWPQEHEPRYVLGFSATAAFAGASIVCAWVMRAWLIRLNKRLDEAERDGAEPLQRYVY